MATKRQLNIAYMKLWRKLKRLNKAYWALFSKAPPAKWNMGFDFGITGGGRALRIKEMRWKCLEVKSGIRHLQAEHQQRADLARQTAANDDRRAANDDR